MLCLLRLPALVTATALLLATPAIGQTSGPPGGTSSPGSSDPDLSGATVVRGTLADGDATRANGQLKDGVATVNVGAGQTLTAEMTSADFDTYLILEAVGGGEIAHNDDYHNETRRSVVTYENTSRSARAVLIVASAFYRTHRGAYTVRYVVRDASGQPATSPGMPPPTPQPAPLPAPQPTASSGGTLAPGTTVRGTVERLPSGMAFRHPYALSGYDEYSVALTAGQTVTFVMNTGGTYQNSGMLSSKMNLGLNDRFVATSADVYPHVGRSRIEFTPTVSGTYRLLAGTASTRFGDYDLTYSDGSPQPVPAEPLSLTESSVMGVITRSDPMFALVGGEERHVNAYTLDLRRGQQLTLDLGSMSFDTYLRLDRDGALVAENDDRHDNTTNSQIVFTADHTDTYTVYVGAYGSSLVGGYTLNYEIE